MKIVARPGQLLLASMVFCGCAACPAMAQSTEEPESAVIEFDDELDELEIDVQGSIDDVENRKGFSFDGDLRAGYVFEGEDFQDLEFGQTDVFRARWRLRSIWGFSERFRGVMRVAGVCSSDECSPEFILQPNVPTSASIEDGQVTIDSMFFQWYRTEKFDVAVGRMETKMVARGGVYAKSLDRNDSNNLRVNWTDGLHSTYKAENGWESNLILQYNSSDGPSNVRREPLDFSSSKSRLSYFLGFENLQSWRRLIQRGLDITYMPSSLRTNGLTSSTLDDYWGIVVRAAWRWPVRTEGWRLRLSSEAGYAPNTADKFAVGIVGTGETNGLAWNFTASVMDFLPGHSIGINFAETEAGWLLSPQYGDNERLMEIRYMWRPRDRMTLDIRGRWRDDLHQRLLEDPGLDRFDFYMRLTWAFQLGER